MRIYVTKKDTIFKIEEFKLKTFSSKYLKIDSSDNTVFIPKGYAWDGCTPTLFNFFDIFYVGTPEGVCSKDGYPKTYRASLLHDALYQYLDSHNLSRKDCDIIFYNQLVKDGFKMARIYYYAVRLFGGLYHKFSK